MSTKWPFYRLENRIAVNNPKTVKKSAYTYIFIKVYKSACIL